MGKDIRRGTFHLHNDKNGGHPALIYYANHKNNLYKCIKFTHKPGSRRTRLKHNIDPIGKGNTYVIISPVIDKKRNFGSKELKGLRIHKEDKPLINYIKRKK